MKSYSKFYRWMGLFLFWMMTQGVQLLACPGCRDSATQSVDNDMKAVQAGFSWSVLVLMTMPLTLISAFVFWVIKLEKERTEQK